MSLHSFERKSPPLFRRSLSPLARLGVASALSVFFMLADSRLHWGDYFRSAAATVLAPLQWLGEQPVKAVDLMGAYVTTVESAQQTKEQATIRVAQQALKAQRADLLLRENASLRDLLGLQQQLPLQARAAQVEHVAADPFVRKLVIDKGSSQGVVQGSPVIDENGLVGQVVRVFARSSEVSLVDNLQHATPVLNNRTGERSLVYGDSQTPRGNALEIRFLPNNTDVQVGDIISTSGTGGIYPAGLPVGRVAAVEKHNNSAFMRVQLAPFAKLLSVNHVLVLEPIEALQTEAAASLNAENKRAAPAKGGARAASAAAKTGVRP
ncbi:MAG: rod shape-determining protein MreC [Brachymonas sp.]|jgi:rod shape-determining protein MreC|nr:rod shape-determining protein MreC [Brachymonas sp.]MBP6966745.1 rod shape-determining protein MreC [Brachymonas sp.]MBP7246588.1 rod shape-determining protein MreC [Brachymonas sp.]MBP7724757.1 rod shape-determining protein MreC [Brachymonas sp.]MBP7734008.1 rod shape-determining protein MreC [Brachymonas sp.]